MAEENIYAKQYKNHRLSLETPAHEFHKHVIDKETRLRKKFHTDLEASRLLKSRNTLEGELLKSERKDEVLVPGYQPPNARCRTAPAATGKIVGRDVSYERCVSNIGAVEALRQRRKDLALEMEHLQKVMEHKKLCLAAGGYGGYGKLLETLHPALEQVTRKDYGDMSSVTNCDYGGIGSGVCIR